MRHEYLLLVLVLCGFSAGEENSTKSSSCGRIFTEKEFELISDNYPNSYPPNSKCFYLFKGDNCTRHFKLQFVDFDIKYSKGCTEERLEIGLQAALCGSKNGSAIYSAEEYSLGLKFISGNESSNKGFKILVSRIDSCIDNSTIIQVENRFDINPITESSHKIGPTYLPPYPDNCCQHHIFSSIHFFLMSPGFPYSTNKPHDCFYVIQKASANVCRLRINIHFFSLGYPNENSCFENFLAIDGKYICGCNRDIKLIANFKENEKKFFRFHTNGKYSNDLSGFVLEVIQDDCPKRYTPNEETMLDGHSGNYRYFHDQTNRISWPKDHAIDQLKLVDERVDRNQDIYKHIYFFAPDDSDENVPEKEETDYVEISTINTLLTDFQHQQQCISWNRNQLSVLMRTHGDSLYQMCPVFLHFNEDKKCQTFSSLFGYFNSPGYPSGYYGNQKLCHRFYFQPGYCTVYIGFQDFNVEQSYDCQKDYLMIGKNRYCGNYLKGKTVTVAAEGKPYQDITFVTDANYCGKGFSAEYQQVSCSTSHSGVTPPASGPGANSPSPSDSSCPQIIMAKSFEIVDIPESDVCSFYIRRFSKDVCKIRLYFKEFNLSCSQTTVNINGRVYCGNLSGQTVTLDADIQNIIVYHRNLQNMNKFDRFLIKGAQITDDCNGDIPTPARFERRSTSINFTDVCQLLRVNTSPENLLQYICIHLNETDDSNTCTYTKIDVIDTLPEHNLAKIVLSDQERKLTSTEILCETI